MVQTKRRRKWKCHESGSSIFLTIWQARGTTCLYHPHHIERNRHEYFAEKPMWEICFERGAKSIFRLSGEVLSTDRYKGDDVHCLRRTALIGRWNIFPNGYGEISEC